MPAELSSAAEREPPGDGWPVGRTCAFSAALWLAVSAAVALQVSALGGFPFSTSFILSLFDWGPWILLTPVVVWLAHRVPIGPGTWRWALPAHLVASLAVIVLTEVTMSTLSLRKERFMPMPAHGHEEGRETRPRPEPRREDVILFTWFRFFDRARMGVPIYWMLVAGVHALAHQRRSIERERRALRAEAHLAEARLAALQAQLNPHFLFNTLNTIAQLVYENPPAAEATIVSLSELLRAALAAQQRREVPLREEMAFVERYCAIQKIRFADRLEVRCEIDPGTLAAAVPTLLLQPLVENAIIHGVAPGRGPGRVIVRAWREGERLQLEVADTGGGNPGGPEGAGENLQFREGVGLANTRARLEALYGGRQRFTFSRAVEGGVVVKIEIPFRPAASS